MYRCKKTGVYYVNLSGQGGTRTRRSTGTKDRKLAEEIEAKWKSEQFRRQKLGDAPKATFEQIAAWYLRNVSPTMRSHDTNVSAIKSLRPHLAGRVVTELTIDDVDDLVAAQVEEGLHIKTVHRQLAVLSSALTKAGRSKEFRGIPNPIRGNMPVLDEHDHRIRWEERPVVHQMASQASPAVIGDAILFAAYSGMRQGEILGLEWSRVDLNRRIVHLAPRHQKNKKFGTVALNESAYSAILRRKRELAEAYPGSPWVFAKPDGSRMEKDWLRHRFGKVAVADFRFHDLRHCFCTWLLMSGAAIAEVKEAARHRDIRTTLKYAHLQTDHIRRTVGALDSSSEKGQTSEGDSDRAAG